MEKEIFSQFLYGEVDGANRRNETAISIDSMEFQTREKDFFDTTSERSYNKRKARDGEEMRVEEDDLDGDANKRNQRAMSARRSRTTEMHNLSERKRRDKINEKLKALQELLPHCTKTDKASMLDEAIEYLKSLQIQLQMMWMENGMAPMVFPDVQQYMSIMGMDHHTNPHSNMTSNFSFPKIAKMLLLSNGSNPIQIENLYLPQLPPQGINQDGYGSRLVQHEHPFGNGLVMGKNSFL